MVRGTLVVGGACVLAFGGPLARAADEPPALVESPACAAPSADDEPVIDLRAGQTLVTFDVVAVTRIRLDDAGAVAAVATNTRCAPRATDTFVVGDRAATAAERAGALAAGSSGDWREPGAWHVAP